MAPKLRVFTTGEAAPSHGFMGLRFRKSIRLMPGIRLNLSKSGVSASLGGPGATVNIGKRGVRGTVGVPSSGPVLFGNADARCGRRGWRAAGGSLFEKFIISVITLV